MRQFQRARRGAGLGSHGGPARGTPAGLGRRLLGAWVPLALELMRPLVDGVSFPEIITINLRDDYGKN